MQWEYRQHVEVIVLFLWGAKFPHERIQFTRMLVQQVSPEIWLIAVVALRAPNRIADRRKAGKAAIQHRLPDFTFRRLRPGAGNVAEHRDCLRTGKSKTIERPAYDFRMLSAHVA